MWSVLLVLVIGVSIVVGASVAVSLFVGSVFV